MQGADVHCVFLMSYFSKPRDYCVQIYVNMCGMMFRAVCLGHLGVWGELASHKRLFNPPSQFSRLGIQVSPLYNIIFVCMGW